MGHRGCGRLQRYVKRVPMRYTEAYLNIKDLDTKRCVCTKFLLGGCVSCLVGLHSCSLMHCCFQAFEQLLLSLYYCKPITCMLPCMQMLPPSWPSMVVQTPLGCASQGAALAASPPWHA